MNFNARLSGLTLLAALAISLSASGCKSGPTLVGKWAPADATGGTNTLEFKDDKTFDIASKSAMGSTDITGNYKLEEKALTLTVTDLKVDTKDPRAQAFVKPVKEALMKKAITGTIAFKSDDEVTLTLAGLGDAQKAQTLKRIKDAK